MKLNKKYTILLGIFISIGLFITTSYGKDIVHAINKIHEDKFTSKKKNALEKLSKSEMQEFLQTVAELHNKSFPIILSDNDIVLNLIHKGNTLSWIKKINYDILLQLPNIKENKELLTKILTDSIIKDTCSQKLMSYMVIHKNIFLEYKFNDWDMKLIDNVIIDKSSCINWHKNNKTYTLISNLLELFSIKEMQ